MKILITGANGFIGRALILEAITRGLNVRGSVRENGSLPNHIDVVSVGDISFNTNWDQALKGCDVVVHLAARAHDKNMIESDLLNELRNVNVLGTIKLAKQAVAAGVRRFIFLSSIGVNGAESFSTPISYIDTPAPHSPYAISKYEAELELKKIAKETELELIIIRPPLVYGPNAPGNFGSLIRLISFGLPLPLGLIKNNRRSYIALDNLVDLILTCIFHFKAANQIFLVSDGEDISTTELLNRIRKVMNRSFLLIPIPVLFLNFFFLLIGKKVLLNSLICTLQLDIKHTCNVLNWSPPISLDEGLRRAVGRKS